MHNSRVLILPACSGVLQSVDALVIVLVSTLLFVKYWVLWFEVGALSKGTLKMSNGHVWDMIGSSFENKQASHYVAIFISTMIPNTHAQTRLSETGGLSCGLLCL